MVEIKKYKYIIAAFFLLTFLNILIYFYRNNFDYIPYRSYAQLYSNCLDADCLNKWRKSRLQFRTEDINIARRISHHAGIKENDNTQKKIEKLFLLLHVQFNDQIGRPTSEFSSKTALEKYFALQNNQEQLWCGNFAEMFLLFCTANNIVCRYVEIFKPTDHHVINECFVTETNRWTLIDLTTNVFNIRNHGKEMGLLDIVHQPLTGQNVRISASGTNGIINNDSTIKRLIPLKTYIDAASQFYYYYTIDLEKVYNVDDKIIRYFLPISWYELVSTTKNANWRFILKLFVFILWLINTITLVLRLVYDRSKRFA